MLALSYEVHSVKNYTFDYTLQTITPEVQPTVLIILDYIVMITLHYTLHQIM